MPARPFPSYWMYKDNANQWRWTYHAANGRAIAVSSEAYHNRSDCERSIDIMKASSSSEVWMPTLLVNAT